MSDISVIDLPFPVNQHLELSGVLRRKEAPDEVAGRLFLDSVVGRALEVGVQIGEVGGIDCCTLAAQNERRRRQHFQEEMHLDNGMGSRSKGD